MVDEKVEWAVISEQIGRPVKKCKIKYFRIQRTPVEKKKRVRPPRPKIVPYTAKLRSYVE